MFEYASNETYSNDGTSGEKKEHQRWLEGKSKSADAHNFDSENHVDGSSEMATWDVSRAHCYR